MRMAFPAGLTCILVGVTVAVASAASPALSRCRSLADVNVVTAIDESESVGRHGEWLQYHGMAEALKNPEFLQAVRDSGLHHRIGFLVLAWSSGGSVRVVLPWMLIASKTDARRAADLLEGLSHSLRPSWEDEDETGKPRHAADKAAGTDLSAAIDAAIRLLLRAPCVGERGVINILANGRDNVGPGPRRASRRAVTLGFTVNGLVFGHDRGLTAYFREQVIGGPGGFVLFVQADRRAFEQVMVRKFLRDLLW